MQHVEFAVKRNMPKIKTQLKVSTGTPDSFVIRDRIETTINCAVKALTRHMGQPKGFCKDVKLILSANQPTLQLNRSEADLKRFGEVEQDLINHYKEQYMAVAITLDSLMKQASTCKSMNEAVLATIRLVDSSTPIIVKSMLIKMRVKLRGVRFVEEHTLAPTHLFNRYSIQAPSGLVSFYYNDVLVTTVLPRKSRK